MAKDLYDFSWFQDEEIIVDEAIVNPEEQLNDEGVANPSDANGDSEEVILDDVQPGDKINNEPENPGTELESKIDSETDELDKELKELEDILNWDVEWGIIPEDDNLEVSDKLKDAVTKMKSLVTKIDKLELENAELTKFWWDAQLSPEVIIIKAHYDKAMKWDEAARNKIKELISTDLWLEVADQKQVFVSNSIAWWTDINTSNENDEWGFWFVM